MNNKTNSWAAIVGTRSLSEAVQRVAFTFGYGWKIYGKEIMGVNWPVLVFNPDDKTIGYSSDQRTVGDSVCKICVTFDQVMELFKNPPKAKKVEEVGNVKVYEDGSLLVADKYILDIKDVDKVVEARNKLMGKKVKLPVVRFRYSSPSSGERLRKLMVVEDTGDGYGCLDMEDGNAFKRFRKDRIVGATMFVGFEETE